MRPNPEERINRNTDDRKNDRRTEKKIEDQKMNSTVHTVLGYTQIGLTA